MVPRFLLAFLLLVATTAIAQDVYVPPVPIGIKGAQGKAHIPKRPIPFPAADEAWIRIRTPHFDLISSASEERTRAIAGDLERFATALIQTSSRFETAVAPTRVFVFERRRESQPYFDLLLSREKTTVSGVYVRASIGGTMFIDSARRFARTATHELVHDLLRHSERVPPLWLEEGLAEYFSNATIRKDEIIAGAPIPEHLSMLQRNAPPPIEELLAVRAESDSAAAPLFYAQSWAAVDWLMQHGPAKIYGFIHDLEEGVSVAQALSANYGKTLDDMSRTLRNPGRSIRATRIPAPETNLALTAAPVDRATLLYELGRFLSHVGGAEEDSQRHLRGALEANPKHAPTLAALGRFEEAIASDPNDAETHLIYAESLLGDAVGPFAGVFEAEQDDVEPFRKARSLAERALKLGAEEGRARGTIGATYVVEHDVTPAIPLLERARELDPARIDFALHLYGAYLRMGQRAKAEALYAAAFERARDKQTVFAARNMRLRFETERANALAKSGKLDEAASIVRELAAATDDAFARKELEQQAAQLVATAAVNRHIEMYNQAVSMSNAGRKRDALKILDELLRVATDPQVVRDAQRLRGEVKGR